MFDDIGNLVYIIVFAIWFLYRVFGKAGKKTAKPMPPFDSEATEPSPPEYRPTEPARPTVTFEEVLRELTGAPTATQPIPEVSPEFEEDYPIDDIGPTLEETSFEVHDTAEVHHTDEKLKPTSNFVLKEKLQEFAIKKNQTYKTTRAAVKMLRSKHGAKQAFIMKEIFDRKY